MDECRKAFEAWGKGIGFKPIAFIKDGEQYRNSITSAMWQSWQAAWNRRAPSGWIACKDNMPGYYKTVWVADGSKTVLGRLTGRSYKPPRQTWKEIGSNYELYCVTHWQECIIPAPPKDEQ